MRKFRYLTPEEIRWTWPHCAVPIVAAVSFESAPYGALRYDSFTLHENGMLTTPSSALDLSFPEIRMVIEMLSSMNTGKSE